MVRKSVGVWFEWEKPMVEELLFKVHGSKVRRGLGDEWT